MFEDYDPPLPPHAHITAITAPTSSPSSGKDNLFSNPKYFAPSSIDVVVFNGLPLRLLDFWLAVKCCRIPNRHKVFLQTPPVWIFHCTKGTFTQKQIFFFLKSKKCLERRDYSQLAVSFLIFGVPSDGDQPSVIYQVLWATKDFTCCSLNLLHL